MTTERPTRELPATGAAARRRAAKAPAWPVIAGTAGVFFALLAFLAMQVRDGRDPALGPAPAAPEAQPRQVVVRRIIRRVVIHHPPPREAAPAAAGAAPAPSGGAAPAPAPAASAPAPAAAAPPAAAPPPPPPAPLTTQSS